MTQIADFLRSDAPAQRKTGAVAVGTMASGAPLELPYIAVKGARPGKTLWINGQVHGDEINGIVAALRLVSLLDPSSLQGNVVVTPTANPQALDLRRKRNPYDELDMDQTYPGSASGLVSERLAAALIAEMRACADMVLSLHTMNPLFDSRIYAVYKVHPASGVSEALLLRAISLFRPNVACRQDVGGAGELPGNISGALDYQCLAAGIPAFMLELGSGSIYQPDNVAQACEGFLMLARDLGIVGDGVAPAHADAVRRVTRRNWLTFSKGGFFVPSVQAGAQTAAGETVGETVSIHGDALETIVTPQPSIIIGVRHDPVAHTGERAAFVATEWDNFPIEPQGV